MSVDWAVDAKTTFRVEVADRLSMDDMESDGTDEELAKVTCTTPTNGSC